MTSQTVGNSVARRDQENQIVGWLRKQQDEIAMAAASHVKPSAIIRVTQGALRKNPKLMAAAIANPQSLLSCLLEAARLGHEPDTDDYYLVPFGNEVTGIEGYKGIVERMYRAGGVLSVVAQVRRERDRYVRRGENTPPLHEYDDMADPDERGPLKGAYAYATLAGGHCSQVIAMGRAEIMEHKAKSRGSDKSDSPWQQWPAAMWKKTALRSLEPFVQTSTEYRRAARGEMPAVPASPVAAEPVYDAEIIPDDPSDQAANPEPTAQQVNDQFKRLGFTVKDQAEVLGAVTAISGRPEPVTAVGDLGGAELGLVCRRLAGCGSRDDVVALLVQIADSKGGE